MTTKNELKKRLDVLRPQGDVVVLVYVPGDRPQSDNSWFISSEEELEKRYKEAVRLHGEENVIVIQVDGVGPRKRQPD